MIALSPATLISNSSPQITIEIKPPRFSIVPSRTLKFT